MRGSKEGISDILNGLDFGFVKTNFGLFELVGEGSDGSIGSLQLFVFIFVVIQQLIMHDFKFLIVPVYLDVPDFNPLEIICQYPGIIPYLGPVGMVHINFLLECFRQLQ